jgi:chitosanase
MSTSQFPKGIPELLERETGFDAEQWNNVMKLVSKPEQDDIEWNKPKYMGYCQMLKGFDDKKRGFTISFFGATTGGTEAGDADRAIFKPFGKTKESLGYPDEKKFVKSINDLGDDDAWCAACWKGFVDEYVKPSMKIMRAHKFKNAITLGFLVDSSLNQGNDLDHGTAWLVKQVGDVDDEKTFLKKIMDVRDTVVEDPKYDFNMKPNGKARVNQWRKLFASGEIDLKKCDEKIEKFTSWKMK